ncbi:hypothetical protein [Nocardia salmonicida]|uniref:hypothetical protein n=1 Tax=Nocardia salmonicida TaxID=53431 RepID=UPI0007A43A86|nr:hypothetical protein [Nocardia salmonicida]MBC7303187.1 hypothetical protein [Nocardia sp.]
MNNSHTPAPYVLPADAYTRLQAALAELPGNDPYDPRRPTAFGDWRWVRSDDACLAILRPPHAYAGLTPYLLARSIFETLPQPDLADLDAIMVDLFARQHTIHEGQYTIDCYRTITVADATNTDPGATT